MKRRARVTGRPLTVRPAKSAAELKTADVHQTPDYTVTDTTDGGGPVLTSVEVAAIFWGSYWSNTSPAPSPTPDTYYTAFTGLVTGPYMTGLRQYRGVGPGTMLGKFINDTAPDPVDSYTDTDVVNMLTGYFQNNPSVPAPTAGHSRFYAVVTPPGINNKLTYDPTSPAIGQHQSFTYSGVTAFYCWVDSAGGLTDATSDGVVNIFSHELVEACTDPLQTSWQVDGELNGKAINKDEIGDTCNNEFAIVDMLGVQCNVQCYWSAADNACILPLGRLSFLVNKNTFGKNEVQEAFKISNGVFSNAFWLALDDYSIDTFNAFNVAIPTPTGAFANLSGVTITPSPATPGGPTPAKPIPVYEDPSDTSVVQRIRFSFDITFAQPLTTPFPASGGVDYALTATFTTNGTTVPGDNSQDTVNFELVAGADPFFSNIDVTNNAAVAWLSQDLRVFAITKGESALANDSAAPTFDASLSPYDYIQKLIGYLNGSTAYTSPNSSDPLNGLPGQTGYETGDSSVTPLDGSGNQNYNFAIARVRLTSDVQGASSAANDVRVFFRLWVAPSFDTDFQPNTTYPSNPAYPGLPANPLPSSATLPPDPSGQAIQTTPFFATVNGAGDYDTSVSNNNIRDIEIPMGSSQDSAWAYYGCFLDIYDASNNASYPGTHHCLVAQIAYDNAPLLYDSGTATNPGNTDKLAQRNLQITLSGNPGPSSTHRIPQAFDTRPSPHFLGPSGRFVNKPDELMIDWGHTPVGAKAQIYWPDVPAAEVLALAKRLYGTHKLTLADAHTLAFEAVRGVTYIPIPSSKAKTFAGLFTVDLPLGVKKGQEFNILVRRVSTAQQIKEDIPRRTQAVAPSIRKWRYVTGTFQIKIPVTTEEALLGPEENTLAILKARLAAMSPAYRWFPVLQRYIDYVSGRVAGAGGDPNAIRPSLQGVRPKGKGEGRRERAGKISGLIFDGFGDFEGFLLDTEEGEARYFSRERDMRDLAERAWRERLRLIVWSEEDEPLRPVGIVLLPPPAGFRS